MAEDLRPEVHIARDRARIGIQQQLRRVVAQPAPGVEWTTDPKSVRLPRRHPRHETVPNVAVAVRQHQLSLRSVGVEQAEPHLVTTGGHREVRAPRVGRGTERIGPPGHDFRCHRSPFRDTFQACCAAIRPVPTSTLATRKPNTNPPTWAKKAMPLPPLFPCTSE